MGFDLITPRFYIFIEKNTYIVLSRVIMCSKINHLNKSSNYAIYCSKDEYKENYIGILRSNFMDTEYLLYDKGVNPKDSKIFGD